MGGRLGYIILQIVSPTTTFNSKIFFMDSHFLKTLGKSGFRQNFSTAFVALGLDISSVLVPGFFLRVLHAQGM